VFEVTKISIFLLLLAPAQNELLCLVDKVQGLSVAVGFFWQQYVVDFQV
jgi:hypothetical protein